MCCGRGSRNVPGQQQITVWSYLQRRYLFVLFCACVCVRVFAYNIYMFPAFMVAIEMCAYVGVSTLVHVVAGKKALHPFVYN